MELKKKNKFKKILETFKRGVKSDKISDKQDQGHLCLDQELYLQGLSLLHLVQVGQLKKKNKFKILETINLQEEGG